MEVRPMEPLSGQLQQAAPAYPSNVAIQENVKVLLSSLGGSLLGQIPGCPPLVDRFTLQVPLLGGQAFLSWGVVMDAMRPEVPPDFIFPPGDEASFRLSELRSLANWRPTESPTCLLECVAELLTLYKERQKTLAKSLQDERLHFEVSTIVDIPGTEFLLKEGELLCLVPIATTPELQQKAALSNLTPARALSMAVSFKIGQSTMPTIKLMLPTDWEHYLGKPSLPAWSGEMCLITYMPLVMESVEEHLAQWFLRRSVLFELAEALGSPLEFDFLKNRSIHFLHNKDIVFTISITLSESFPGEQPEIIISSLEHHRANSQSLQIVYRDYPYSPRWPPKELATRIKKFLGEKLTEIKKRLEEDFKRANTSIAPAVFDISYQ